MIKIGAVYGNTFYFDATLESNLRMFLDCLAAGKMERRGTFYREEPRTDSTVELNNFIGDFFLKIHIHKS